MVAPNVNGCLHLTDVQPKTYSLKYDSKNLGIGKALALQREQFGLKYILRPMGTKKIVQKLKRI